MNLEAWSSSAEENVAQRGTGFGLTSQRGVWEDAKGRTVERAGQRGRGGLDRGPTAAGTVLAGARVYLGSSGLHPVRVRVIEREGVARGRWEEGGEGSPREVE